MFPFEMEMVFLLKEKNKMFGDLNELKRIKFKMHYKVKN